jgi:hypothetical protein
VNWIHLFGFVLSLSSFFPPKGVVCRSRQDICEIFVFPAVDLFHFRNHVGKWCRKHVNPHKVAMLSNAADRNMSVAEMVSMHVSNILGCPFALSS